MRLALDNKQTYVPRLLPPANGEDQIYLSHINIIYICMVYSDCRFLNIAYSQLTTLCRVLRTDYHSTTTCRKNIDRASQINHAMLVQARGTTHRLVLVRADLRIVDQVVPHQLWPRLQSSLGESSWCLIVHSTYNTVCLILSIDDRHKINEQNFPPPARSRADSPATNQTPQGDRLLRLHHGLQLNLPALLASRWSF